MRPDVMTWKRWSETIAGLVRSGRGEEAVRMIDQVSMTEAPRLFVPPGYPPIGSEFESFPPLCAESLIISAGHASSTVRALIDSYVAAVEIACVAVSVIPGEQDPLLYNAAIKTLEKPASGGRVHLACGRMYEIKTSAGAIVPTNGFVVRIDGKREVVAMVEIAGDALGRNHLASIEDLKAEGVAVGLDWALVRTAVESCRRVNAWKALQLTDLETLA